MKADEEGFLYPYINDKCINCNLCRRICPVINEKTEYNNGQPKVIGAYSNNENERKKSSSGGIFYELARYILEKNGVVIGAGYDKDMKVIHKIIYSEDEISLLQGSKYVQSDTLETFKKVKEIIKENKRILYIGTPCQIAGLKAYLKNDYELLYTCDLICHGVPSPMVWSKYLNEKKSKGNIKECYFRNKDKGWNKFGLKIVYEDDKNDTELLNKDKFLQLFLKNYSLRPSCYDCKFSKIPRVADISLGDFWGGEGEYKEFCDDKGTSLILINNEKGRDLFNNISANLIYKENCNLDYAIKYNSCINSSVEKPENRKEFFNDLEDKDFKQLVKKYIPKEKGIINRIIAKLHRIVKKIINYQGG